MKRVATSLAFLFALLGRLQAQEGTGLEVEVSGPDGSLRVPRYVAILENNHLLQEQELPPEAGPFRLKLPSGTYQVFCGAEGHATRFLSVAVEEGKLQKVVCGVIPLVSVLGKVVAKESGEAIPGAEVAPAWLFLEALPYDSPLLQKHLRVKHLAITGKDGIFRFGLLPGEKTLIAVKAPGRGFKVLGPLAAASNGLELGSVELEPGGTVEVSVDLASEELSSGRWWVDLWPLEGEKSENPKLSSQETMAALLSQRLDGEAKVVFSSVPPGEYAALLTTVPNRLLWKTDRWRPPGVEYRPSHSSGRFFVAPGSFQIVGIATTSWKVVVSLGGISCSQVQALSLKAGAYHFHRNAGADGTWIGERDGACQFEVVLDTAGLWLLKLGREEGEARSSVVVGEITLPPGRGQREVNAAYGARELSGRVVDVRGDPVFFASVSLADGEPCSRSAFQARVKTDREGKFSVPLVPTRKIWVLAGRQDLGWAQAEVAPDEKEPPVLRLKKGKSLQMRFLDAEGNPLQEPLQFTFVSQVGTELTQVGQLTGNGEILVENVPELDGQLIVPTFSPEAHAKEWAHLKLNLPAEKRGFLGVHAFLPGGTVVWHPGGLLSRREGEFVALEAEDGALLGTAAFEVLVFGLSSVAPGLDSSKEWKRVMPGRYRLVVTDKTCKPLQQGKSFLVLSGQAVERRD